MDIEPPAQDNSGSPCGLAFVWKAAPGVGDVDVGGATVWGTNAVAGAALLGSAKVYKRCNTRRTTHKTMAAITQSGSMLRKL